MERKSRTRTPEQQSPIYRARDGWRVFVARLQRPGSVYDVGVYTNQRVAFSDAHKARSWLYEEGDPLADEYEITVYAAKVASEENPKYEHNA